MKNIMSEGFVILRTILVAVEWARLASYWSKDTHTHWCRSTWYNETL